MPTEHPADVADTLGRLLLRGNRIHLYTTLTADHPDVDETTYPVLSGLARHGAATASELAQTIGLDRTVTTRYARRLESTGLIERGTDAGDARKVTLALTERGAHTVEVMRVRLAGLFADAMAGWSEDDCATFARLFGELADNLVRRAETPVAPFGRRPSAR